MIFDKWIATNAAALLDLYMFHIIANTYLHLLFCLYMSNKLLCKETSFAELPGGTFSKCNFEVRVCIFCARRPSSSYHHTMHALNSWNDCNYTAWASIPSDRLNNIIYTLKHNCMSIDLEMKRYTHFSVDR
jgi:hypothetical protein